MCPFCVNRHINICLEGECALQCTQFEGNLELHIASKVATPKISFTLNNFRYTYKQFELQN
jgi:hypothetical protein